MHHRKQKNTSHGNVGKSIGRKESGIEAMARLRYLNKKPLCLQYNVQNSYYAKRNAHYSVKRREQSFIVVIFYGICKLVQWAVATAQKAAVDFLTKPAHELFPFVPEDGETSEGSLPTESAQITKKKLKRSNAMRRDVARMLQLHGRSSFGY
ncbi:unnamed protein product [Caenorhabditis auriculariae]|uniref:Uncharacterized protein n=1 Tax=Caenorhabditis auriculariae TaxID=2777116 RepID=A0A8S1HKJ8_9PELO|nr:unnamed protein product [Caenorhabditis auriculariae]